LFFFFQAEDGIRDFHVTGVQTCALPIFYLTILFSVSLVYGSLAQVVAPGATLQLVAGGFSFTEGPAADRNGNVFFTDQPNNRIWRYGADGSLAIFMEPAGRANGLYFDNEGNLIACADEQYELWRIGMDKEVE